MTNNSSNTKKSSSGTIQPHMHDEKSLNEQQKEAVTYGDGPLLLIAGAGTGKTTVITERIKHLILKKNVLPSQILALTFTEKAAQEMEERIDITMPYGYTELWIATFHAFCDRILKDNAIHIGLNPSYTLATQTEAVLFLRKNLFKFQLDYFRPLGNPNKFLEGMLQHFSRLKDEDVNPEAYLRYAQEISNLKSQISNKELDADEIKKTLELAHAYKTYEDLKAKEGVMDFSDLIAQTLRLFRTRKHILKQYQNQFQYLLVDEFQDTNYAQNQLALLLAGEKQNITVVGDDDQAIYRWRGAAISNMLQFRKHFPKTKIIALTKNYRSTEAILDASYQLIQHNNPDRLEVKEHINKKLTSERNKKGEEITFIFANRGEDEAEMIAKKINELTTSHEPRATSYRYSDIAILVRANDHAQAFIRSLERAGIPYQFLGPGQLFKQEEIKDLIAYIKLLAHIEDTPSLYRILSMEIFGIEPQNIASLLATAKKINRTLFETLVDIDETDLPEDVKKRVKNIIDMIKRHLGLVAKDTTGQILYYFLQETGILQQLLEARNEHAELQAKNIARFFDKLKSFEAEHEDTSVFSVAEWIDISAQMGEDSLSMDTDTINANAVNILTIHASKGLEFPCVFLVNLVTQRFPTRERKEQIPTPTELIKEILPEGDYHLQEERRLFYVGMTRAKDKLFFSAAKYYGEGKRERKISPFVPEAINELIVKKTVTKIQKIIDNQQLSLLEWSKKESQKSESTIHYTPYAISYLSYSQIQTFDVCPLHYKLKYIIKVPTPQSPAQSFGTSIHSGLRDFYKLWLSGEHIPVADAPKLLERVWLTEGYQSREHEKEAKEKAKKIFTSYLEKYFNPKNLLPLALELPFIFSLSKKSGLKVGGRIDRIDQLEKGKIEIIDYKTGKNMPSEKELSTNEQLTFYALAATEVQDPLLNTQAENILLSLHYLETDEIFTTTRTKEQLGKAKTWILEKTEEISTSDFMCSQSILCKNCEYKMLCQV